MQIDSRRARSALPIAEMEIRIGMAIIIAMGFNSEIAQTNCIQRKLK